nr:nucleoside deaminase [Mesorhizobium loti]
MVAGIPARYAQLMEEAIASCVDHVHDGGIPFIAFVIDRDGTILGRGVNRVREHHDPTAHAEVEAIRDACRSHGTTRLAGMTLLASGEPCAMCYMSAWHAGLSEVFYAVDRDEVAAHGFDYRSTYHLFANDPRTWRLPVIRKLAVPGGQRPFLEFRSSSRGS